jgi:FkbM family methyltransferase
LRERLVQGLLRLYERTVKAGLLDRPWSRRVFESVYLTYKRLLEAGPTAKLGDLVEPGSSIIDVGANIGFFAVKFGRWVGSGGRVIAIEPEARNLESLRGRVQRAGLADTVECVQAVAAAQPGELRLAVNPSHPGDHQIASEGERVRAVTLDELIDGEKRRVSLIKIDVQGAESMVLAGARAVLERDRPALFVEVDDEGLRGFGSSARELVETLADLGYEPHRLTRGGIQPVPDTAALLARATGGSYTDLLFLSGAKMTAGR